MNEGDIIKELTEATARSKSNTKRIDKLEDTLDEIKSLASSTAVLAERYGTLKDDVGEIKTVVNTLKEKPEKCWEALVEKALWLVIGGLITFAFAKAGINL